MEIKNCSLHLKVEQTPQTWSVKGQKEYKPELILSHEIWICFILKHVSNILYPPLTLLTTERQKPFYKE